MQNKNNHGITLIALVITIIVLLILAGVSLNLVSGSNGILGKAGNAVNESNKATAREEMELVIAELTTDYYWKDVDETLFDYLVDELAPTKNYTTANGANVVCDEKGDITYTKGKTIYTMSLGLDGKITLDNEKIDKKIRTAEELKAFAEEVNAGTSYEGKTVALMNDIDLSTVCGGSLGNWIPIGTSTNPFKGIFDGQKYRITNLRMAGTTGGIDGPPSSIDSGLFGVNKGYIKNCFVSDSYIFAYDGGLGGIVNINSGMIESCSYSGSFNTYVGKVGPIAYSNGKSGTIKSCYSNNISVSSSNNNLTIGGIVYSNSGTIESCYNNARLSLDNGGYLGGIAYENSGNIESCYNSGSLGGMTVSVGGIACTNSGKIESCYNKAFISGNNGSALAGITSTNSGSIKSCYNIGSIYSDNAGGVVCSNGENAFIENCFYKNGIIMAFNDTTEEVSGQVEAKTETELKTMAGTLGEAFKEDTNNINNGYPILNWQ